MDWVILAGTVGHEVPWTRGLPRPLLPLPRSTLLEALLSVAHRDSSDGTCTICANGHTDQFAQTVRRDLSLGYEVGFVEDRVPRGPAGCLKACEARLTGRTIAVTGGAVWVDDDPQWMFEQHRSQKNVLTVFCTPDPVGAGTSRAALLRPAGLYFCEPAVLEFIRSEGYQDLKEQLIPTLQRKGLRVGAVRLRRATCEVSDWSAYLSVLGRVLSAGRFDTTECRELGPGIWADPGVGIGARARIVGPVLFGRQAQVADGAVVVGPAIVGRACHLASGSWVIRSILTANRHVPEQASIIDQFVPPDANRRGTGAELFTVGERHGV